MILEVLRDLQNIVAQVQRSSNGEHARMSTQLVDILEGQKAIQAQVSELHCLCTSKTFSDRSSKSSADDQAPEEGMTSDNQSALQVTSSDLSRSFSDIMLREEYLEEHGFMERATESLDHWASFRPLTSSKKTSIKEHRLLDYCIMDPHSKVRVVIDSITMLVLLCDLFLVPIHLAWDQHGETLYSYFAMIFWTLELAINFFTGFYKSGTLEMRPEVVARHYFQTWFFPDALLVVSDWVRIVIFTSLGSMQQRSMTMMRVLRMMRLCRMTAIVRGIRLLSIMNRIAERISHASSVFRIARLLICIVWVNHIIGCIWYAIGRYAPSDTHQRWTTGYSDYSLLYQYATAFHWSLSQMTPGSMQVHPVNVFERMFSIICLIFGVLVFSSLVSSLSAQATHYNLVEQDRLSQISMVRKFLRSKKVSTELAVAVEKQVEDRMRRAKPLQINNISALTTLSLDLKSNLQFDLVKGKMFRHPLFRWWGTTFQNQLQEFCTEGVEWDALDQGDTLFKPSKTAEFAHVVVSGVLTYSKAHSSSSEEIKVPPNTWICEVVLWCCCWKYLGTAHVADGSCELFRICPAVLVQHVNMHSCFGLVVSDYARTFHRMLETCPSRGPFLSDLPMECCEFSNILLSMNDESQYLIGQTSLHTLSHSFLHQVFASQQDTLDELQQELQDGQCVLMLSSKGEVERLVAVTALQIERQDGRWLVELGKCDDLQSGSNVEVTLVLPGTKQLQRETPMQASHRIIDSKIPSSYRLLNFMSVDSQFEKKFSAKKRLSTKYIRTVMLYSVALEADPLEMHAQKVSLPAPRVHRKSASRKTSWPTSWSVFFTTSENKATAYTWMFPDEFSQLSLNSHELQWGDKLLTALTEATLHNSLLETDHSVIADEHELVKHLSLCAHHPVSASGSLLSQSN